LINACKEHKYLKVFSPRSRIRREVYDRLAARWSEFGLEGKPPRLTNFEDGGDVASSGQTGGQTAGQTGPNGEAGFGSSSAMSM
jgi:hypothetical protein